MSASMAFYALSVLAALATAIIASRDGLTSQVFMGLIASGFAAGASRHFAKKEGE